MQARRKKKKSMKPPKKELPRFIAQASFNEGDYLLKSLK